MIKVVLKGAGGKQHLLIGLTAENLRQLQVGRPAHIDGDALGIPIDIGIFVGTTGDDVITLLEDGKVVTAEQATSLRKYYKDNPE